MLIKKYLLLLLVTSTCVKIYGGIIKTTIVFAVPIHKSNYKYFISNQNPGSAIAVFLKAGDLTDKEDSIIKINPDSNKVFINRQIANGNISFFRCFFKNAKAIYRYIDLNANGKIRAEAFVIPELTQTMQIVKFYPSGPTQSRTSYKYTDTLKSYSDWYGLNPNLVKNGTESFYYANNTLRIQKEFKDGVLKDTSYQEFDKHGKVKTKFTVKGGQIKNFETFGTKEKQGVQKALLCGINLYSHPKGDTSACFELSEISAKTDVLLLNTALRRKGFSAEDISLITGDDATKKNIVDLFNTFLKHLHKGDFAFIHFSAHGLLNEVNDELRLTIPCRDIWKYCSPSEYALAYSDSGAITQSELQSFLKTVQSRVGITGQVILSLDVSHSGALVSGKKGDEKNEDANLLKSRGENNNILFNFIKSNDAPSLIFTATQKDEMESEVTDEHGIDHGALSYALYKGLNDPSITNSDDLYQFISDFYEKERLRQNPGYLAKEGVTLFENDEEVADNSVSLPPVNVSGNAYAISVGVSKYNVPAGSQLTFNNASSDAYEYANYFTSQYNKLANSSATLKLNSTLLQNETATKEKILAAINDAISKSKPDDYFIFNFSGYCKPLPDSSGKNITYFVPYGLNNLTDAEIRKNGISLKQLKDLLQLIPANNQLFITEAGSTKDFQREFIQALIETSPTIASLSNKNRIFLVPKSSGFDNCTCNNRIIEHGPLNYYITNLTPDLNIFGLFDDSLYAGAIKYAITKSETDCNYFRTGYFDIFFEKDFVKDLKYFLPEEVMKTRGAKILNEERDSIASSISKRYALIVGTNKYKGKPEWPDLDNPVYDANEIAESLSKNFGFETIKLLDQPADSLYNQILWLNKNLKPSDQLLVFVAGHGDFDARLFDDGFIVCNNSLAVKEDPFRNSYIQYSKLSRMINKLPSQQILLVLDVCFGGTFDERVARNKSRGKNDYDDLESSEFIAAKMKKKTRLYLTSGGKREVPEGYAGKHSPFAVRLLEALQPKPGKILTASNMFDFVHMLPSGPLIGSFGDDEPGSEFVLLGK